MAKVDKMGIKTPDWRTWEEMQVSQTDERVNWLMDRIRYNGGNLLMMAKEIGMDVSNLRKFVRRHGLEDFLNEERDRP